MLRKGWLIFLLVLFLQVSAYAIEDLHFKGFIADEVGVLSDDVKYNLNMTLWDLQKKAKADIAVVVIQSLNGKSVEQTAIEIGREYKVGSREKNNGIVFLTALNEHKMRLELGTGLEDKVLISDLEKIRDKDILPYYRNYDYENGIARGTYKLADLVARAENVTIDVQGTCPDKITGSSRSSERAPWWLYVIALIMAPFSRRRRSSFGSFGGFGGGGGFGGSGCSGSW